MYCARQQDTRVSGLCLANPWLRSAEGLAKTHVKHYYRQRLMQREFWIKLLTGGVAAKALRELGANLRLSLQRDSAESSRQHTPEDFRSVMARGWHGFQGPVLLLSSRDDYTAREFIEGVKSQPAWKGALDKPSLKHVNLPEADHTFSSSAWRVLMEAAVVDWLHTSATAARPSTLPRGQTCTN
jgi:uncharacterized protein